MFIRPFFFTAALLCVHIVLATDSAAPEISAADIAILQKADAARRSADFKEAYALYKTLADQGNARAETQIGLMYRMGELGRQDNAQAMAHFRQAATAGDGIAQFTLGLAFQKGNNGAQKDDAEAARWFAQALGSLQRAAERQDAEAQRTLAMMYRDGLGVAKDEAQSKQWLHQAAENGDPLAQTLWGTLLAKETGAEDIQPAIHWLQKAAEQNSVTAQDMLAHTQAMLGNQQEADKWYRRAFTLNEKAARQGKIIAQFRLGIAYRDGKGIPADADKARDWLAKAAAQGNDSAQKALQELKP